MRRALLALAVAAPRPVLADVAADRPAKAARSLRELGEHHLAIGDHAEAAALFERHARAQPNDPRAADALAEAVVLRLATGAEREAVADAELLQKTWGALRGGLAAKVAFALAAHAAKADRWPDVERRLKAAMALIDRRGGAFLRFQAHALLGHAHAELGREREARAEYGLVVDLGAAMEKHLREPAEEPDATSDRALAKALTALGEAHVYFAREAERAAASLRLPVYRGKPDEAAILRWVEGELTPTFARRRAAVEAAERRYAEVDRIQPVPPPRWLDAAAAGVMRMWAALDDELGEVLGPAGKKAPAALISAAEKARGLARARARATARLCVDQMMRLQFSSPESQTCAAWLSKDDPLAYPALFAVTPRPRWLASGIPRRAQPLPDPRTVP